MVQKTVLSLYRVILRFVVVLVCYLLVLHYILGQFFTEKKEEGCVVTRFIRSRSVEMELDFFLFWKGM